MVVGYGTVWRFFEREALRSKKSVRAAEQERPDVAEARRQWKNDQTKLDPTKLVFVDETGASTQIGAALWTCQAPTVIFQRQPSPVSGACSPRGLVFQLGAHRNRYLVAEHE